MELPFSVLSTQSLVHLQLLGVRMLFKGLQENLINAESPTRDAAGGICAFVS
jgi:hypothetical protein